MSAQKSHIVERSRFLGSLFSIKERDSCRKVACVASRQAPRPFPTPSPTPIPVPSLAWPKRDRRAIQNSKWWPIQKEKLYISTGISIYALSFITFWL